MSLQDHVYTVNSRKLNGLSKLCTSKHTTTPEYGVLEFFTYSYLAAPMEEYLGYTVALGESLGILIILAPIYFYNFQAKNYPTPHHGQ